MIQHVTSHPPCGIPNRLVRWRSSVIVARADGLSLRPFFDHSIGGLDLQWGINNGYLVDIHAYSVRTATDIGAVPVRQQVQITIKKAQKSLAFFTHQQV